MALVTMRVMTPRPAVGGRYRLGDKLGQGAAGVVWKAWDVRLGRTVAVKQLTIPPGLAGADARRAHADAAREGRIAARLQHPAVAAMLDMVVENGSSWLVMEHAPGRSLLAALEEKPLPPLEVARIGAELADALAVAHAAGVVHCDVKPANVLLGDDGTVKLADFGIARAVRGEHMTGPLVLSGTPLFMAPEVARGTWPDGASDVFSLAATLYAAVEGTGPFGAMDHDDPVAMIRRVAETAPRPARRAGPLTAVLTSLLAIDPAARPTAAAARDLLREIATPGTAPVAVAPSAAPGVPRSSAAHPPRRARTLTALSTLGVVGVGAVAGTVGGGSVLAAVTSTAPAPFDHIAILGGTPAGTPTGAGPSSAPLAAPAAPGLDQGSPPVPATGAPIVPESDGASSSGDGAAATTARAATSTARSSTGTGSGSVDRTLPVDAGVIHDVPLAGPVLGDTVAGVGSTVDDLRPVDLGIGDGPLGLPVHLGGDDGPLGLPVDLPDLGGGDGPLGLPVNLPVDLGSGDGEGPLGLPVDLGGGGSADGPLGLPVNLPVNLGSNGSDGSGGSDGLPVRLPVDLGGDGPLGLPLGGSANASSDSDSDSGSGSGSGSASSSGSSLLGLPGGLLGGGSSSSQGSSSSEQANPDDSDGTSRSTASSRGERSGSPLSVLSFPGTTSSSSSTSDPETRSSDSGASDADSGSSRSSRSSEESGSRGVTSTLGSVLEAAG